MPEPRIQTAASSSAASEQRGISRDPFDLGPRKLAARVGDFVIAPSRSSLERAANNAQSIHTFAYAGAYLEHEGETSSRVRWLTAQRGSVPNSLLISIEPAQTAEAGSVVLSALPGFGLERLLVVTGGQPDAPRAFSLDRVCSGSSPTQVEFVTLEKSTFGVLRSAGELGGTLACREGVHVRPWIITAKTAQRWLAWGVSGQVQVFTPGDCRALPVLPEVKVGDVVSVPVAGEYVRANVRRVEAASARVFVQHDFAAEPREHCVPLVQVTSELP